MVSIVDVRPLLTSCDGFQEGNRDGSSVIVNGVAVICCSWCLLCVIGENVLNDMRKNAGELAFSEGEGATSLAVRYTTFCRVLFKLH